MTDLHPPPGKRRAGIIAAVRDAARKARQAERRKLRQKIKQITRDR